MKPERLEFVGLKSYSEPAVVDFAALSKAGLFGIFGDTGSGKSTVLDALFYALYGKFPESSIEKEDFINAKAGKMKVDFTFSVTRGKTVETYRVVREQKDKGTAKNLPPQKAVIYRIDGGREVVIAEKALEVTAAVENILGLDLDEFSKCIVLPQGQFSAFLGLPRVARLTVLSDLFSLNKYGRSINEKISVKLKELRLDSADYLGHLKAYEEYTKERFDALDEGVTLAEKAHAEQIVKLSKIEEDFNDYKQNYDRHNRLLLLEKELEDLTLSKDWFDSKQRSLDLYFKAKTVTDAAAESAICDQKIADNLSRFEQAKGLLDALYKEREVILPQVGNIKEIEETVAKLKSLVYVASRLVSKKEQTDKLERERLLLREKFKSAQTALSAAQDRLNDLTAQLCAAESDYAAFDFGGKLSSLAATLSSSRLAETIKDQLSFLKTLSQSTADQTVIDLIKDRVLILENRLNALTLSGGAEVDLLKDLLDENQAYLDNISSLKNAVFKAEGEINAENQALERVKEQGVEYKARIDEYLLEVENLSASASALGASGEDAPSLKASLVAICEQNENKLKSLKAALERFAELPVLEEKLSAFKEQNEALEKDKERINSKLIELLNGSTLQYFKEVVESVGDPEKLRRQIDDYNAKVLSCQTEIADITSSLKAGDYKKETYDLFAKRLADERVEEKKLYNNLINLQNERKIVSQNYQKRCTIENEYGGLKKKLALYERLADAVYANRLVEFIADEYLAEVCSDAAARLSELSGGRYGLSYNAQKSDFFVTDYLSGGIERKTSTVSGGELFLVSLSLALSLSLSITAKNNRPIEFFFLDEGFGSLDSGLVDVVMTSLEKLRRHDFTIGLISHVDALKERVPLKLNVTAPTAAKGSTITMG